jgi:Holliday junction resolvase RusA-like endonuclease
VVLIEVPGVPVAKGRPKFARIGKGPGSFVTTYSPSKTVHYEDLLRFAAKEAMNGAPLISGPVRMAVTVQVPVPASYSNKKRIAALSGELWPAKKPDIDNYIKIAMDGLNCVVFCDDNQVVSLQALKIYSETPSLIIKVTEFSGANHNERTELSGS